jgi:hypothetical protein
MYRVGRRSTCGAIRAWIGSGRCRTGGRRGAVEPQQPEDLLSQRPADGRGDLDASGAEPVFGKPVALFIDDYDFGAGASIANYDVTADGAR